jgi:hypothetical protein
MSFNNGPRTVVTGLSLLVDAADPLSYPGSGTSWTDIVTGITGSLSGSITYASDFKGTLVVNNSSSVIIFPTSSGNFGGNSFTVELAFQPNQINGQHWLVAKNSGSFPSWGAFITGSSGSGRITAFFNVSSTISCSMSTPTGSIVTGSNYLVDINFFPNTTLNTIYLNSELSGSIIPNGGGSLTATSSLFISNRNSGSSVGTPLEIFNTKLYTPRLVAGMIRQNYNSLSTRLGLSQKPFIPIVENRLLDTYADSSAAYSLRLLSLDYAGSAIRVRRSSDNTEQDIGFSNLFLDTAALLSFVGAGNGFVTTWYDQSGNSINITQTTAANQPPIVSSGALILVNNKPAINFTTHFLTYLFPVTNLYVFTVSKLISVNFLNGLLTLSANASGGGDIRIGGTNYYRAISTLGVDANDYTFSTGETYFNGVIHTVLDNATNQHILSVKRGTVNVNSGITVGSSLDNGRPYNGGIQEVVFYKTDQSTNRTAIESNINSYYQIF